MTYEQMVKQVFVCGHICMATTVKPDIRQHGLQCENTPIAMLGSSLWILLNTDQ